MRASPWSWHLKIELSLLHTVKRQNKDIFFLLSRQTFGSQPAAGFVKRHTSNIKVFWQQPLGFNMAAFAFFERWRAQSRALDNISSKSQVRVIMRKDVFWWLACRGAMWGPDACNFGRQDKEATVPFHGVYFSLTSIALVLSDLCWCGLARR